LIQKVTAPAPSDAELVARCRAGDADAWRVFVERFSRYVYAIAVSGYRLQDQDAEDVFQDVFTRVYQRIDQLRDPDAVRPWLAQLTRRTCLDRIRAGSRVQLVDEVEEAAVDDTLAHLEDAWEVRDLLARLSDGCRDILDRFFVQDQSYVTIGEELGIPSGTIASRLSRCLASLRAAAEGRIEPPGASGGRTP
jgi:RNA polymerase sigma factor (sigma-70 family)